MSILSSPDYQEASIAAIATPPGAGGIGIIRLSGPQARPVLLKLFRPKNPARALVSHQLSFGSIVNPQSGAVIDEVLAVFMAAPRTYTREDLVEIHCHGSYLLLNEVLAQILRFPGTRLAEPGEFTKRAFLNGRIDLSQAEAVSELLSARTRKGAQLAVDQIRGGLHQELASIRDSLVAIRATLEVAIDFPDEDAEILDHHALKAKLDREVSRPLSHLLARADRGRILREGVSAIILGRPNVGKSSLLNRLLQEERAIVSEIPGTTRDTIEEFLDIQGIPVRIIDTAGIREHAGTIEAIGIERARNRLREADLVLLVLDGTAPPHPEDLSLVELVADKKTLIVLNKIDQGTAEGALTADLPAQVIGRVAVSARTGEGIEDLEGAICRAISGSDRLEEPAHAVPNARHAASLSRALDALTRVNTGFASGLSPDLLAIDLQDVLNHLGEITGETTTEDVLDRIFAEFCLGK